MQNLLKKDDYDTFLEKYGDVVVTFAYYHKYSFYYITILENGNKIKVSIGGDSDEIYFMEVYNNESYKIRELKPNACFLDDERGCSIETYCF